MFFKGLVDGKRFFLDGLDLVFSDFGLLVFQDIVSINFSVIPDLVICRRLVVQRNSFEGVLLNFGG